MLGLAPQTVYGRSASRDTLLASLLLLGLLLVWPWISAGTMLLFRASMRRAKVRTIHLARVTIYSADVLVWLGLLLFLALAMQMLGVFYSLFPYQLWPRYIVTETSLFWPIVGLILLTYRLGCGIGKYLRFRHAMAMALSVQIILVLLVLQILMTWRMLWR